MSFLTCLGYRNHPQPDNASRSHCAEKARFFRSRTRLGVDFGHLGAPPSAPGRPSCRPWPVGGPEPPFQGQLDVQGTRQLPFQGQLDVQGSQEPSFFRRFSSFFKVASRKPVDSKRGGPKLCFCRQAQYFRGFAEFAKQPGIARKQPKFCKTAVPGPT